MLSYPLSVFLDTNIFIGCKYDLGETGILIKLKNLVNQNKVKLYVSDIVVRETERHLKLNISNAINELKRVKKQISREISLSIVKDTQLSSIFELPQQTKIEEVAINNLRKFLRDAKVTILDNKGIDVNRIIDDYFNSKPPFENREIKKYEFPDAFIISKLKNEFNENKPVWIISSDKGFRNALCGEEGINCLSSIKELLDMINKQEQMYHIIVEYINSKDTFKKICDELKFKIESDYIDVDGIDYDRKGYCEGYEYTATCITDVCIETIHLKSVDEISNDLIYLTILSKAKISALCTYYDYHNSIWDSDEKEYIYLSERQIDEEHNPEFECNLTLKVNSEDDNTELSLVDISYNLTLNQSSRTKRSLVEDPWLYAQADTMDTLEDYYKH